MSSFGMSREAAYHVMRICVAGNLHVAYTTYVEFDSDSIVCQSVGRVCRHIPTDLELDGDFKICFINSTHTNANSDSERALGRMVGKQLPCTQDNLASSTVQSEPRRGMPGSLHHGACGGEEP